MSLTPEQVKIIKSTAPVLEQYGDTITTVFYGNMLAAHPDLNNIFNTTNQVNGHQPRALAASLYAYAKYIDTRVSISGPSSTTSSGNTYSRRWERSSVTR
jgi:nitric oxide dioxygenase